MTEQTIEGTWEELLHRADLRGRRVRVTILGTAEPKSSITAGESAWLSELRAWVDSHPLVSRPVDDSREGIYSGTIDDMR
jgi:hypothetical protein